MNRAYSGLLAAFFLFSFIDGMAMDLVRVETRADEAVSAYGLTGEGVVVAVLDRGIDWDHPDFLNENGTTRIKWMLDMSGFNLCEVLSGG